MLNAIETIRLAREKNTFIPAFNIPYLPMVEPVMRAVMDEDSIAIIHVARVEWEKFESRSLEAVADEYRRHDKYGCTMLGLDHIPVIDEDLRRVDYLPIFKRAIDAGYQSVMIDASRLDIEGNIKATRDVADLVHSSNIACEGELGAVMGHESGPGIPYEEIFSKKIGFTNIDEARRFALESGCDWLSVAVGSVHGAVAQATRNQKKPEARLDIDHIAALYATVNLPLVLHGGSGIQLDFIKRSVKAGIAKINVGTEIRQVYIAACEKGAVPQAQEKTYQRVRGIISDMGISGSRKILGL